MPSGRECRACHAKSSKQTSRFDSAKYSHSRKSAPNMSDSCVSCAASAMRNASLQSLSEPLQMSQAANVREATTKPSHFAHFWQYAESLAPATKNASTSKTGRCMWCFYHFDFDMIRQSSTCALRHSGVHFFNIPTSKRAPSLRRFLMLFAHFDFEICCAPPWRALFQQLNFQKLRPSVFSIFFSLRHVFCATTACIFVNISMSKSAPNLTGFSQFWLGMCFAPQRRAIFHLSSGQMAPHPPL